MAKLLGTAKLETGTYETILNNVEGHSSRIDWARAPRWAL